MREYLPTSLSTRFLVSVHNPDQVIFPDCSSIRVSSGYETDIVVAYVTKKSSTLIFAAQN